MASLRALEFAKRKLKYARATGDVLCVYALGHLMQTEMHIMCCMSRLYPTVCSVCSFTPKMIIVEKNVRHIQWDPGKRTLIKRTNTKSCYNFAFHKIELLVNL